MDGVIVDSMPYHYISWFEALKPYRIQVTAMDIYEREGEKWQKLLGDLLGKRNNPDFVRSYGHTTLPKIFNKIVKSKQKIFKKYFKRYIFTGAIEFIRDLKDKGYKLAIVSGTPQNEIVHILPKKISGLFDVIVGGDNVKHGKPHPEPYLLAAKRLKLKPNECAVIENAPLGIQSAKSAGMFCYAVTTSLPKDYLKQADVIVKKLEQIILK